MASLFPNASVVPGSAENGPARSRPEENGENSRIIRVVEASVASGGQRHPDAEAAQRVCRPRTGKTAAIAPVPRILASHFFDT